MPPTGVVPTHPTKTHSECKKSKRTRTAYSQLQLDLLELAFHVNPYPDEKCQQKVAFDVGLKDDRVQVIYLKVYYS